MTLITNEEIRLGKDDIKQGSSENILVLNESENLIINLNHVVKITKLYNERFSMHDVNFKLMIDTKFLCFSILTFYTQCNSQCKR